MSYSGGITLLNRHLSFFCNHDLSVLSELNHCEFSVALRPQRPYGLLGTATSSLRTLSVGTESLLGVWFFWRLVLLAYNPLAPTPSPSPSLSTKRIVCVANCEIPASGHVTDMFVTYVSVKAFFSSSEFDVIIHRGPLPSGKLHLTDETRQRRYFE